MGQRRPSQCLLGGKIIRDARFVNRNLHRELIGAKVNKGIFWCKLLIVNEGVVVKCIDIKTFKVLNKVLTVCESSSSEPIAEVIVEIFSICVNT